MTEMGEGTSQAPEPRFRGGREDRWSPVGRSNRAAGRGSEPGSQAACRPRSDRRRAWKRAVCDGASAFHCRQRATVSPGVDAPRFWGGENSAFFRCRDPMARYNQTCFPGRIHSEGDVRPAELRHPPPER